MLFTPNFEEVTSTCCECARVLGIRRMPEFYMFRVELLQGSGAKNCEDEGLCNLLLQT